MREREVCVNSGQEGRSRVQGGVSRSEKREGGVSSRKKGASPGIEPGPLAPEANIIPLNYEAVQ